MDREAWLPNGYELADGLEVRSLASTGLGWQVAHTANGSMLLLARPELAQKWFEAKCIDEYLFGAITVGSSSWRFLLCSELHMLSPVERGRATRSKVDALAFSLALKETRKLAKDVSFHDALYVEQYSRLLPTWTLTPQVEDDIVLGTWLAGGVITSANSFRRLSKLAGWVSPSDLADIVVAAGFPAPSNAELIGGRKPRLGRSSGRKGGVEEASAQSGLPQPDMEGSEIGRFVLPGRPHLEEFFNEHVVDIIFNADKYQKLGIDFPSAIVLHGPPGCGKTFAVDRLVEFIDWPSYSINSSSIGSPYIHQTSVKISEVFDNAIDTAPSIIIIDEMESFLSDRMSGGTSGLYHVEEVAEFLRRIPEAINSHVLIIAMTNMIDVIDPAILRRGRFDHVVEVSMPSRTEVETLLTSLLDKLPKSEDLILDVSLDLLMGRPLSDSAFVIREAARLAAKAGKSRIDQESIASALAILPDEKEKNGRRIGFTRN